MVGGQPFTSYIWPTTIKKPVLYPLRTAKGVVVTRGYPLDPRPGERVDHPHHVGLWFNYGNVDGYDFWNNSDAIEAERQPHMGTIVPPCDSSRDERAGGHPRDRRRLGHPRRHGPAEGDDDVRVPRHRDDADDRSHDDADGAGKAVSLGDNKEGVLGLRVARQLEIPSNKPEVFTDASGKATDGADARQRGRDRRLPHERGQDRRRRVGHARKVVRAVRKGRRRSGVDCDLRSPANPGYPTYWHARGYGLFAANPLGQKDLSNGKDQLNFALAAGQSATFHYRILIVDGSPTAADTEAAWKEWTSK